MQNRTVEEQAKYWNGVELRRAGYTTPNVIKSLIRHHERVLGGDFHGPSEPVREEQVRQYKQLLEKLGGKL